jgi:hypothetical protein
LTVSEKQFKVQQICTVVVRKIMDKQR